MVDQREALAVTTGLTDTVYSNRPVEIRTVNPCISKQQPMHFTNRLSGTWNFVLILFPVHVLCGFKFNNNDCIGKIYIEYLGYE